LSLIKKALNSNKKYTVIFEDDITILSEDLNKDIIDIINKVNNFDIIYLGTLYDSKSTNIVDNIYKHNKLVPLHGTHAYIINNNSASKILNYIININNPFDIVLKKLIDEDILDAYVIYPSLVIQNNNFNSTLRPQYVIYARILVQKIIKLFNLFKN
jgi:hypothetical protein